MNLDLANGSFGNHMIGIATGIDSAISVKTTSIYILTATVAMIGHSERGLHLMQRYDWRNRLRYSVFLYSIWWGLATCSGCMAIFTGPIAGEWGWALGFTVGAIALSAHARIERLDGHEHHGGVQAP